MGVRMLICLRDFIVDTMTKSTIVVERGLFILKVKKIVYLMLIIVVLISGCSHQNNNIEESKKTPFLNEKTTDSATESSSVVSTAVPATAIPTALPKENHNKREDAPVEYAEANYFKERVKDIIYYKDGKKYTIAPDTEQGKQIILMAKQRYVNTGEYVLRKNKLKKKVSVLQQRGKALEIKFTKQCYMIYTGGKSNDYKKVSINFQSWFYPLEGENAKCFIPLPNRECTYEKLGDAKELSEYLEKCIE